jgi:hypothetical protein
MSSCPIGIRTIPTIKLPPPTAPPSLILLSLFHCHNIELSPWLLTSDYHQSPLQNTCSDLIRNGKGAVHRPIILVSIIHVSYPVYFRKAPARLTAGAVWSMGDLLLPGRLIAMLSRREYLALFGSFILIFLEGVIRIITLGLRGFYTDI